MQKFIWSEYFETQSLSNTVWPGTHYVVHKLGLELTEITCSVSHENTLAKRDFYHSFSIDITRKNEFWGSVIL